MEVDEEEDFYGDERAEGEEVKAGQRGETEAEAKHEAMQEDLEEGEEEDDEEAEDSDSVGQSGMSVGSRC